MRTQRGRFGERGALPVHHQRPQQHGHGQQAAQHQRAHVAHCGEAAGGPVLPQKGSQAPPRGHQVGSGYGAASPEQGTVPQFPSSASWQYKDTLGGQGCLSLAGCSEAGEQGESKMGAGDVPGETGRSGKQRWGGGEGLGDSRKPQKSPGRGPLPAPCPLPRAFNYRVPARQRGDEGPSARFQHISKPARGAASAARWFWQAAAARGALARHQVRAPAFHVCTAQAGAGAAGLRPLLHGPRAPSTQ